MKPTQADIRRAIGVMTMLEYFPTEPATRTGIADLLYRMVGTREQLEWLVQTLINQIGKWPNPGQLRAIFATRYKPADGIEGPPCEIAGFTPVDGEQRYVELEAKRGVLLDSATPRLLEGEVETVTEDHTLQSMIGNLASAKQMPSTPKTRLDDRKRVREILTNAEKA